MIEHHVSCTPSKIPYVGFSPVRLQTEIQPRPSRHNAEFKREARIHSAPRRLYVANVLASSPYGPSLWERACPAGSIVRTTRSRGPWLASGLCCPTGSSLTMASSEAVVCSRRLIYFVRRVFALRPRMGCGRLLPQFKLRAFSTVPPSVPRRSDWLLWTITFANPSGLRPLCTGSASALSHARRFSHGFASRDCKVRLMLRPGGLLALHRQGRLLPSFHLPSRLRRGVEYSYAGKWSIPAAGLPPARHAPYGLRAKTRRRKGTWCGGHNNQLPILALCAFAPLR